MKKLLIPNEKIDVDRGELLRQVFERADTVGAYIFEGAIFKGVKMTKDEILSKFLEGPFTIQFNKIIFPWGGGEVEAAFRLQQGPTTYIGRAAMETEYFKQLKVCNQK